MIRLKFVGSILFFLIPFYLFGNTPIEKNGKFVQKILKEDKINDDVFTGEITYKNDYTLKLFPSFYKIDSKREYYINTIEAILIDNLRTIKEIYIEKPVITEIKYPYTSEKNNKIEDSRQKILSSLSDQPHYFPLVIKKLDSMPEEFKVFPQYANKPDQFSINTQNDLYLFLTIQPLDENSLNTTLTIYYDKGLFYHGTHILNTASLPSEIEKLVHNIEKKITGPNSGQIFITGTPQDAGIYIDNIYKGKLPLTVENLRIGSHILTIRKTGYKEKIENIVIDKNKLLKINIALNNNTEGQSIKIISKPEGAEIYLDVDYLGKTPVTLTLSEKGRHRLKITKDGYLDYNSNVNIGTNGEQKIFVNLKRGSNENRYNPDPPLFWKVNNKFMLQTNAILTAGSFFSWLYFTIQKEQALTEILSYKNYKGSSLTSSQHSKILELNRQAAQSSRYSQYALYSGTICASMTIFFFVRYVYSQDLNIKDENLALLQYNPIQKSVNVRFQHKF